MDIKILFWISIGSLILAIISLVSSLINNGCNNFKNRHYE